MASGCAIPSAHCTSGPLCSKDRVFGCPAFFGTLESSTMSPGRHSSTSWLSDCSNLRAFVKWWGLSGGSDGRVRWEGVCAWWLVCNTQWCLGNITPFLHCSGPS